MSKASVRGPVLCIACSTVRAAVSRDIGRMLTLLAPALAVMGGSNTMHASILCTHCLACTGLRCPDSPLGTFWLGAATDGVCYLQVGEACKKHGEEITALLYELYPVAQLYGLEAVPEFMQHYCSEPTTVEDILERILAYSETVSESVPSLEMARTEWALRNGFFIWRHPSPLHIDLLRRAGFGDLVDDGLANR